MVVRTPPLLIPTSAERVTLPSGREVALPKTTPRFPKWKGEFPWSTYGGKPILDLYGEPLYAEIVILRLLEAEGWTGVWETMSTEARSPRAGRRVQSRFFLQVIHGPCRATPKP